MARIQRIQNGAPINYERGTDDQSVLPFAVTAEEFPLHCPVWYIQTQKGMPGHALVNASDALNLYGTETFNLTGKYANHQTVGANICIENANASYIHRVTNGTYANIQMYLDVLETDVPLYDRDAEGNYLLDGSGERIDSGVTVPGYKAKWVSVTRSTPLTYSDVQNGASLTGEMTQQAGTMTDGTNTSILYPIYEVVAYSPGDDGNLIGFRHYVPEDLDESNITDNNAFIYEFGLIKKDEDFTSVSQLTNILGGSTVQVSFARDAKDSFDNTPFFMPYMVADRYQNLTDDSYPQLIPQVTDIEVYEDSVAAVLKLLKPREDEYVLSIDAPAETWTAAHTAASEEIAQLFNIVSGTDLDGVPYYTFVLDETVSTNSVRLTKNNNVMLQGGEDRLLSNAEYETYVRLDMAKYADEDSEYHDKARFVDSMLWDTGFTQDTKDDLAKYISSRLDTFVALSTFVDDADNPRDMLTEDEELSIALRLREMMRLYPESDYYGTAAFRGMIIGGSGIIRESSWRRRATLAFDVLNKFCKYMGASNGQMKTVNRFSTAPGNIITLMKDISLPWIPASRRIAKWDAGLNLPLHYNTTNMFWPSIQTIADDDTVLNSPLTALTVAYLNKASHKAWREFVGTDNLTDGQLEDGVNEFIVDDVFGRFDNRFIIEPKALHTNADDARGYSWTLPIDIYASDLKTVQTTNVRVYRRDVYGTV